MKILYVTTVGGTMIFFPTFIKACLENGHSVDIAANETDSEVPACYREWGCKIYGLPCSRSPLKKENADTVKIIKNIVDSNNYDIVHCHTPIAAMCTRIACRGARKKGTRVVYTAHGFHFYKGAPLINWLVYYPVEWICAHWTDALITINQEDYALAKKHMHSKHVHYIPGVGIDISRFSENRISPQETEKLRGSLNVGGKDKLVLSVGELNGNKNHASVIRALARLNDTHVHYAIAGQGELYDSLSRLAMELGVEKQVHLPGFRSDVAALYRIADLYVHPSFREGLPVSVMEAMASGLPCIGSDIRGVRDLLQKEDLFEPNDITKLTELLLKYCGDDTLKAEKGRQNAERSEQYDIKIISEKISSVYQTMIHDK